MIAGLSMPARWFYAPRGAWSPEEVILPPEESHHLTRVLRVSPPDMITVTDGEGTVARCSVRSVNTPNVIAEVLERTEALPPKPRVAIYQGTAKGNKLDDAVEKLAELGVAEMRVFSSRRAVARWDDNKVQKLNERWTAIARSAGKQSRNPFFMQASAGLSFDALLAQVSSESLAVVLWEEATLPLRTVLERHADRVALVIGPEGGLDRDETEALADAGAPLVSLGPQILRAENA
nr:16S rRNA (uracil(1498)-N(3))-methyltransferase [Actinomycetota bacterium]